MMKNYRCIHFDSNKKFPHIFYEISNSKKIDGIRIDFSEAKIKHYQSALKNDLMNGLEKWWWGDSKNYVYQNWKKENAQGIKIDFK